MLNPKIIYITVVMIFIYLVAKFKLIPYFAARKILKDAKNNGNTPSDTQTPAMPYPALPAMVGYVPQAAPVASGKPERRDMYYDYRTVETVTIDEGLVSPEDEAKKVDTAVNQLLLDLRKRGICPSSLSIVPVSSGLLVVYATYIL